MPVKMKYSVFTTIFLYAICPLQHSDTWYKITHTCWQVNCTVGVSKQCKSYQSTWTCLCFGNPTVKLGHQHVWLCIMWLDFAQRLFLTKLQNTGLVVYISINHKVAIVLYFVLQKILTHVKQFLQTCLNRLWFLSFNEKSVL